MRKKVLEHLFALPSRYPGLKELPAECVYLLGCRSFEQFCGTIRAISEPERFCPFCAQERSRRRQQAAKETNGWMLLENEYPHRSTSKMLLVVPKRHITCMDQLTESDWVQVGKLMNASRKAPHHLKSGGLMLRFGNPKLHAGTVEHLHFNLIEPTIECEYRPPFAKERREHAEDYRRMLGLRAELALRGGSPWLFSEDGIKATQPPISQ